MYFSSILSSLSYECLQWLYMFLLPIHMKKVKGKRTVNALPVSLLLAVEDGVLVLGQHLGLGGHRLLPCLEGGERLALLGERSIEGCDDGVDGSEPPSLPGLLKARQSPGGLPVGIGARRPIISSCVL